MRPVLLLGPMLALAGCTADTGAGGGREDGPVAFDDIAKGPSSGVDDRRTLAVRSDAEWAALWDEHASRQIPPPERPRVDFASRTVLAVFKGESPTGCHAAVITSVERDGELLVVHGEWVVVEAFCTQQVTQPHHIVSVPQTDGAVRFDMQDVQREGPPTNG